MWISEPRIIMFISSLLTFLQAQSIYKINVLAILFLIPSRDIYRFNVKTIPNNLKTLVLRKYVEVSVTSETTQ